jgi:hypothetical protein
MARGRRGGGTELREALMALVRTTLDQVGVVREIAVKQAQTQRTFLDQALLGRRRKEALQRLGGEVYSRLLAGDLVELTESTAIAEVVAEIADIDDSLAAAESFAEETPAHWDKSRARHSRGPARIWRPGEQSADDENDDGPQRRRRRAASGAGRGGIAFVEDPSSEDDLANYMHADDVPDEA